ncbi:MAG TPA: type II toxin-antitoxin system VapC family toxin [Gemmataceae bacterium]|nr:type II toxin-antitoxin system VapC family toxin [Gemmataceae bacterium]
MLPTNEDNRRAILLDTDHLSVLQMRTQPDCGRLEAKLAEHPPDEIAVSIVSFQENVEGWLAWIHRAKKDDQIVAGYQQLASILRDYCRARVLMFDAAAQARFTTLRKNHRRVQPMDLRIASIAISNQAMLLTRNRRDFAILNNWLSRIGRAERIAYRIANCEILEFP